MSTDNFLDGSRHADWTDYAAGGSGVSESAGVVTIDVPANAAFNMWDDVMNGPGWDAAPTESGDFDVCVKIRSDNFASISYTIGWVFFAYTGMGVGTDNCVALEVYYEEWLGTEYFGIRRIDTTNSVSSETNIIDWETDPVSTYNVWLRIRRSGSTFYTYYCKCDANDNGHPRAWTAFNFDAGTEFTSSSTATIGTIMHSNATAKAWTSNHYEFAQSTTSPVVYTFDAESSTVSRALIEHEGNGSGDFTEDDFPGFLKNWVTTGSLYFKADTHSQISQYLKKGCTVYTQTQNQASEGYQGSGIVFRYDYDHFGALVVESDTNNRYIFAFYCEGGAVSGSQTINLVANGAAGWSFETPVHLKLVHDSGTGKLTFYYSLYGDTYTEIKASNGISDFNFTSAEDSFWVGLGGYSEGADQINAKFDYMGTSEPSVQSDLTSDEFDDGSVSGDWTQSLGDGSLSEANDQLTFTMATGTLLDGNDGGWIYQTIYGDFTLYTQVQSTLAAVGQSTGLIYKLNDDNKVLVLIRYEDTRAYAVRYDVVDGTVYEGVRYPITTSQSIALKLMRSVNTFTAYYGEDAIHFVTLPAPSTELSCGSNGYIGICAFSDGAAAINAVLEFCGTSIIQNDITDNSIIFYEYPGRILKDSILLYDYQSTLALFTTLLYSYELREWINDFTTLLYEYSVKGWTEVNYVIYYNYIRRWVEQLKTTLTTFAPDVVYVTWEYTIPDGWPVSTQPITFGIYVDGECVLNNVIEKQVFLPDMEANINYVIDVFANVFKNQTYSVDRAAYGRKVKIIFELSNSTDVDHYSIYGDNGTGSIDYSTELDRVEVEGA